MSNKLQTTIEDRLKGLSQEWLDTTKEEILEPDLPIIDPQNREVIAVVHALNKLNNAEFNTGDRDRFLEIVNALGGVLPDAIDTLRKSFTYL